MKKIFSIILILLFTGICFAENKEYNKARISVLTFLDKGSYVIIKEEHETNYIRKEHIKYISVKETELVIDNFSFSYEKYIIGYNSSNNLAITRK